MPQPLSPHPAAYSSRGLRIPKDDYALRSEVGYPRHAQWLFAGPHGVKAMRRGFAPTTGRPGSPKAGTRRECCKQGFLPGAGQGTTSVAGQMKVAQPARPFPCAELQTFEAALKLLLARAFA